MTNQEFYQEFQILYNNIMSNQAPGLDEYEVSVFLTRSQEEFIRGYYNGAVGSSFEETEEVRRYLNNLVQTSTVHSFNSTKNITSKSYFFHLPDDCWFITYECIKLEDACKGLYPEVVPVTQDELHRTLRNPFKGPTNSRVLRLDSGEDNGQPRVELVSKFPIEDYTIRYVSKPSPIVIGGSWTSDPNLTIDGVRTNTECKLHPALHRKILEGAVQLAITSLKPPTSK